MQVGGQHHAPTALAPGMRPGTLCTRGWVGPRAGLDGCGKSRPPPGFDSRTSQPVASPYTGYAIAPPPPAFLLNTFRMFALRCCITIFYQPEIPLPLSPFPHHIHNLHVLSAVEGWKLRTADKSLSLV